ncbi:unnamed protein product [Arctia plantaginis]|uniref:Uncharacterized protein n=1 Tax=Arctia plantaginis TaxID=874455 RepID=A0A8S0Z6C1_ARCPL|nr:unnamed protein product [Arctia plantaginis]
MGSRAEYTEEEIQRVLEESEEENDFIDGSDELFQPEEDEETKEEENEETVSDIEREVLRITSYRCPEQSSVREPILSFFDENSEESETEREVPPN